jgi:hypothetical protein
LGTAAAIAAVLAGLPDAVAIGLHFLPLPYVVVAVVGVWRSADKYRGDPTWAGIAKAAVIVWGALMVFVWTRRRYRWNLTIFGRIGGHRLFLNLRPNPGEGDWLLVLIHQRAPLCSPFLLGIFYCRIFCVKNVRIQDMYIALACIDNPLSRSNRHLPELGTKIQTELTTNYNMPF